MNLNIKKISAVLASGLMVVSGIGFAAAANYPAPFVSGGSADAAVVYGTDADNLDVVAAGNIRDDLKTFVTTTGGSTGSSASGGDSILLAKTSDNLNLFNTWGVFTGTIDETDLSTLLAKGTYVADDNDEFDYEQKIIIGTPNLTHFRDSDYEDEVGLTDKTPTLGFKLSSSTYVMNYTLDFTSDAESDVASGDMEDIEGSDLPLFGKTYYVSDMKNGSSTSTFGKLTLLDSAVKTTIEEGETTTVTLGDKTYSVMLNFIGSSTVKFDVDGQITSTLSAGQTYKLSDGAYIGVREINTQDYAGGIKTVEFSIGSGKLELTSAAEIKLNDDTISGVKAWVYKGTGSSGTEKIDKITVEWKTDEEEFLSPETDLKLPGFEAIKFTMGDFVRTTEEKITIQPDGDTSVELTAPIKDGDVSFNLLYANASGEFTGLGKASDDRLVTSGSNSLTFYEKQSGNDYHSYFVASYNVTSEAESYLLRAKVSYDSGDDRNETTIEKKQDGSWTAICEERISGQTCDIGSVTLTLSSIAYTSGGDESVVITASDSVNFNTIFTKGGLGIYLPYEAAENSTANGAINFTQPNDAADVGHTYDKFYLYMDGEDKDDNIASGRQFYFTIDDTSTDKLQISELDGSGTGGSNGLEIDESSTFETYIFDDVAPRVLHYTNPDEDYVEVYYPSGNSETYAQVYLAETGVVVSSEGTGDAGMMIVKDTEVSSVQTKNLVIVGGSCINSAAATLLGGAYCTTDFTDMTGVGAGEYIIKGYSGAFTAGKMALLVAGYEAADTSNAQQYLTGQTVDTSKEYIGTSATEATMQ